MMLDDGNSPDNNDKELASERVAASYIDKLSGIQDAFDAHSKTIAEELKADPSIEKHLHDSVLNDDQFTEACGRTITSIGLTLRSLIGKSVPRSERRALRTLDIDWSQKSAEGIWSDNGVVPDYIKRIDIQSVIDFAVEHGGGLDGELGRQVSSKFYELMQKGDLLIERLKPIDRIGDTQRYEWQRAFVKI